MTHALREILVHIDASARSASRLALARRLAQAHGGRLSVLYAASPTIATLPYGPGAGAEMVARALDEDEQRRQQARRCFESGTAGSGLSCRFMEASELDPALACAHHALCADLTVLGQHEPEQGAPGVPPDFAESVLFSSGRAALVVPHSGEWPGFGDTVAIAWQPTPEASRAVAAALPLLQAAREVHVLVWEATATAHPAPAHPDPVAWLEAHGVHAVRHREIGARGEVGELLLSRACDLEAQLLVMGCYGHARLREWALGGASRTVLESMTIPVLLAH